MNNPKFLPPLILGAVASVSLAVMVAAWSGSQSRDPSPFGTNGEGLPQGIFVSSVIDGDTVKINRGVREELVRLIGIDTPEVESPYTDGECFGTEASDRARELLSGKEVFLIPDPQTKDRDSYGRLLRYVFMTDGTFVNAILVQEGYAYSYPYEPFGFWSYFNDLEQDAKNKQIGLWAKCAAY